jgi:hypothetical protein
VNLVIGAPVSLVTVTRTGVPPAANVTAGVVVPVDAVVTVGRLVTSVAVTVAATETAPAGTLTVTAEGVPAPTATVFATVGETGALLTGCGVVVVNVDTVDVCVVVGAGGAGGAGSAKRYRSAADVALAPPGVVTVTSTVPEPAGETATIDVALETTKLAAGVLPNATAVAPVRFAPLITTDVPPAVRPVAGLRPVTAGPSAYVNRSALEVAVVPPAVVTCTSTVPEPAGDVAVIEVGLSTVKLAAAVEPKLTAVAPARSVPVIVTNVPPAVGPALGETAPTAGPLA